MKIIDYLLILAPVGVSLTLIISGFVLLFCNYSKENKHCGMVYISTPHGEWTKQDDLEDYRFITRDHRVVEVKINGKYYVTSIDNVIITLEEEE